MQVLKDMYVYDVSYWMYYVNIWSMNITPKINLLCRYILHIWNWVQVEF